MLPMNINKHACHMQICIMNLLSSCNTITDNYFSFTRRPLPNLSTREVGNGRRAKSGSIVATPHNCTRGKAIGSVHLTVYSSVSTKIKIATSGDLGYLSNS